MERNNTVYIEGDDVYLRQEVTATLDELKELITADGFDDRVRILYWSVIRNESDDEYFGLTVEVKKDEAMRIKTLLALAENIEWVGGTLS